MTHAPRRPLAARAARTAAAAVVAAALTVGGATAALAGTTSASAQSASQTSQASGQGDQRAERQAVLDRYLVSAKGEEQVGRLLARPGGKARVKAFTEAYLRDGTVPAGVDLPGPAPKPVPAPAAGQGLTGPEQAMVGEMNEEWVSVGCKLVVADPKLTAAARYHADDMVEGQYFAHTSPSGEEPGDRAAKFGTTWSAENIAAGSTDGVTSAVQLWSSPGHRANISDCSHTRVGIGTNPGSFSPGYGAGVWVQMFGR